MTISTKPDLQSREGAPVDPQRAEPFGKNPPREPGTEVVAIGEVKDLSEPKPRIGAVGIGAILLGIGGVAAGALGAIWLRERNSEEAGFDLLAKQGNFELRRYRPHLMASAQAWGTLSEALDEGFEPLSAYIGAKPDARADETVKGEKIDMAVPVWARRDNRGIDETSDDKSWRIGFTMPAEHTLESVPEPAPGVTIVERPKRRVAVIKFAGRPSNHALFADKRAELEGWMAARGFVAKEEPEYAFYNSPMVPPFARRNEIQIEIDAA